MGGEENERECQQLRLNESTLRPLKRMCEPKMQQNCIICNGKLIVIGGTLQNQGQTLTLQQQKSMKKLVSSRRLALPVSAQSGLFVVERYKSTAKLVQQANALSPGY